MAGTRDIRSRLELFVDDWLIDTMTDTSLKLHPPVPAEVVLDFDQPWEGQTSWVANVILDDGRYRLWYRATGPEGTNRTTCYAESPDGIHFERPTLGLHEFEGSKENNIVMGAAHWNACVFKDPNPAAPDSQRYKGFLRGEKLDERATNLRLWFARRHPLGADPGRADPTCATRRPHQLRLTQRGLLGRQYSQVRQLLEGFHARLRS